MENRKSGQTKKIVRVLFAVVGTAALLVAAWKYVSMEVIKASLEKLSFTYLVLALLAYTTVTAARASRFIILQPKLSFLDAFSAAAVHNALLRIMPLRSGELAYGIMLKRMGKGGFGQGVATVLVLRLLDFGMIAGLTAVLAGTYVSSSSYIGQTLLVAFFVLSAAFLFVAAGPVGRALDVHILSERQDGNPPLWVRGVEAIRDVLTLSLGRRIILALSTALLWGVVLFWFFFLMLGVGMDIPLSDAISAGMLGVVGSMLPLSLVGSFGPLEGGFALGFCAVGFEPGYAATVSVLISTFTFIHNWMVAFPGWGWVLYKSSRGESQRPITNQTV